jgi:photosynthetic reaction center H subunit
MPLTPISDAAHAQPPGGLDVKGWEVRTEIDRKEVGKVDDVLVDESGRARYLDVDLGMFRKHVLVPIGRARADRTSDVVWISDIDKDGIKGIPDYDRHTGRIDPDYERTVQTAYRNRGRHDTESVAVGSSDARLAELGELKKVDVADGEPNPKGWEVYAADGRRIGEVDELIVDTSHMKVRYLDVDLAAKDLGFTSDRHILVPMDQARLNRDDKHVLVDGLRADALTDYPVFAGLPISRDLDDQIQRHFTGGGPVGREDLYADDLYDERAFLGDRTEAREADPARGRDREDLVAGPDVLEPREGGHGRRDDALRSRPADNDDVTVEVRGEDVRVEQHRRGE